MSSEPGGRVWSVFVDRMDGGSAVLLLDDGTAFEVPDVIVPAGTREGDWLRLDLSKDPVSTARRTDAVRELRDRLAMRDGGDDIVL